MKDSALDKLSDRDLTILTFKKLNRVEKMLMGLNKKPELTEDEKYEAFKKDHLSKRK